MTEASKTILVNTIKEWQKFATERDKLSAIAHEVADLAQSVAGYADDLVDQYR